MRAIVICAGGGAGDVLLATPVMRALRQRYDEVVALTLPAHGDVLRNNPDLAEVWTDDDPRLAALIGRLRAGRFDASLVTWSTARFAAAPFLAGIERRVGQARRLYSCMYTDRVTMRSELGDRATHWTEILLDYARALGCDTQDRVPVVCVDAGARSEIAGILRARGVSGAYGVLHPTRGVALDGRPWPAHALARLARAMQERLAMPVVITGTQAERAIAEAIARDGGAVSLAGATTYPQLAALLEGAAVCVALDSGPMHVAAALGTPTVGIFALASDEPGRWAPRGPRTAIVGNTYPCPGWHRKENCPDFACLGAIDVEGVLEKARALLG